MKKKEVYPSETNGINPTDYNLLAPKVLPLGRGDSSVVGRGLAGRPDHDQQRCYRHVPAVKPEAANAVVSSWWWAWRSPKHVKPHKNIK
jgi:hypothetical protein